MFSGIGFIVCVILVCVCLNNGLMFVLDTHQKLAAAHESVSAIVIMAEFIILRNTAIQRQVLLMVLTDLGRQQYPTVSNSIAFLVWAGRKGETDIY
jgi:hypothetical protein